MAKKVAALNFDEFKKRYKEKLERAGQPIDDKDAFNDKMADIYVGLMIYHEYQMEVAAEYQREFDRKQLELKKPKIYVPGLQ